MSQKQDTEENTHFGFKTVPKAEKQQHVRGVFDSVAERYDIMNDVMSLGIHRLWKRFTVDLSGVRAGEQVLDLAGGTGDLGLQLARKLGPGGLLVLSDINAAMLGHGRERLINKGQINNVRCVQANAEILPFADNSFDCLTIGFGLRNVTDKQKALESMYRVIKPGGRLLVLEFSKPTVPGLAKLYDEYSFRLLPAMGRMIADDEESYRYLAESIRMHPDQDTLKGMLELAGFEHCQYYNLTGGIVAVHRGYKF